MKLLKPTTYALTIIFAAVFFAAPALAATTMTQTNNSTTTPSLTNRTGGFNNPYSAFTNTTVNPSGTGGADADVRLTPASAVNAASSGGGQDSLAMGTDHHAYISYQGSDGHLKYATNASGSWLTTTVDSSNNGYATTNNIALDASNHAYISYYDSVNKHLRYATNASGSWVTTTADGSTNVGDNSSIAVDSSGKAYISYIDGTAHLKYATNASGSWVITTASAYSIAVETSIKVDGSGHAYISCYNQAAEQLLYVTNASGSWVTTTVDNNGYNGRASSIALDSSNHAYISYWDITNSRLKYATNASGSWVTSTADSGFQVGGNNSIALDGNVVFIIYLDNYYGNIKFLSIGGYNNTGTYASYFDGGTATPSWTTFSMTKGSTAGGAGSIRIQVDASSSNVSPPGFLSTDAACDFTVSADGSSGPKDLTTCNDYITWPGSCGGDDSTCYDDCGQTCSSYDVNNCSDCGGNWTDGGSSQSPISGQYLWYKATLSTSDPSKSPLLQDASVTLPAVPIFKFFTGAATRFFPGVKIFY